MNMNSWFYIQLAVYEIFDVVPFVILAVVPFKTKRYSVKSIAFFSLILYMTGLVRRSISYTFPSYAAVLSILSAALYLLFYYYVIRNTAAKLLFVLVTILNYASLMAILYSYAGYHLFRESLQRNPYCIEVSLTIMVILAVSFPFIFYWFKNKVRPLMEERENDQLWRTLWFVPATFCVFFYYNLYTAESFLSFARSTRNMIFSLVISAGSFFVLTLVLRLVKMNRLAARLLSEKHQLEMNNLQYQRLSERMEEAKRARHDMRQGIAVIQVYLKNGDTKNLRSYIEKVGSAFQLDMPMVYCEHPALNALICYYAELAAKAQIEFSARVNCPEHTWMQDTDLVVLIGNLLENAVDASLMAKTEKRFVRIKVKKADTQILIAVDNSFDGRIRMEGEKFCSTKHSGYGIGISSVRQIAEKYHGQASFRVENHIFFASVIMKINKY